MLGASPASGMIRCCHASQRSAEAVFTQSAANCPCEHKGRHLEAAAALLLDGGLQLVEGVLAPVLQQRERNLQRACRAMQRTLCTAGFSWVSEVLDI